MKHTIICVFFLLATSLFQYVKGQNNTYSKTLNVTNSNISITFSILPKSVNISNTWDKHIQYNINYDLTIKTENVPSNTQIRNMVIVFENSNNATDANAYPNDINTTSTTNTYTISGSTTNTPTLTGYNVNQLNDQNYQNNTSILPLADYKIIGIKFIMANYNEPNGPHGQYTFENYSSDTFTPMIKDEAALPIQLTKFAGKYDNNKVLLNWSTAQEINNKYFVIERSNDNRSFDSIAVKSGAGNTSTNTDYTYTDYTFSYNNNYYRLRQVDDDGKYTYSNTIAISTSNSISDINNIRIYPNPGKGSIFIMNENIQDLQSIRIYSLSGTIISNYTINANKLELPSSIPSGIYFIDLLLDNQKKKTIKYFLMR